MSDQAFWMGAPIHSRRVRVRIAPSVPPAHWCAPLAGQERDALELHTPDGVVLIDDENGVGRRAVGKMYGHGSYSRLPLDSVILAERPSNK